MKEITNAIVEGVEESLTTYIGQIMAVYDAEDGISFSIPVKLTPGRNGAVQVETGINFIEKRVKDSNVRVVERNQLPLPGMEAKGYRLTKAGAE